MNCLCSQGSVFSARNRFNSKRSYNGNQCKDSVELVQQNRIIAISNCACFFTYGKTETKLVNIFKLKNANKWIALTITTLAWKMLILIAFDSCRAHVYFDIKILNLGNDLLNMVMMKHVSDDPIRKNLLYINNNNSNIYEDWWSQVLAAFALNYKCVLPKTTDFEMCESLLLVPSLWSDQTHSIGFISNHQVLRSGEAKLCFKKFLTKSSNFKKESNRHDMIQH